MVASALLKLLNIFSVILKDFVLSCFSNEAEGKVHFPHLVC